MDADDLTPAYYSDREWDERPADPPPRRRSLTAIVQPAIAVMIFLALVHEHVTTALLVGCSIGFLLAYRYERRREG